jgi:hypothetical protein
MLPLGHLDPARIMKDLLPILEPRNHIRRLTGFHRALTVDSKDALDREQEKQSSDQLRRLNPA